MDIHALLCADPPEASPERHTARPPPQPQPIKLAPHLLNPNHKYTYPSPVLSSKRSIAALINDPEPPGPAESRSPRSPHHVNHPVSPIQSPLSHFLFPPPHVPQPTDMGSSPLRSEVAVNPVVQVKRRSAASLDNIINHDPLFSPFTHPPSSSIFVSPPHPPPLQILPPPPSPSPVHETSPTTHRSSHIDTSIQDTPRKKHRPDDSDMEQLSRRPRGQRAPSGSLDIAASEPMTSARSVLHLHRPSRTPSPTPEAQAQSLALDLGPIPTFSTKRDTTVDEALLSLIEDSKPSPPSRPAPFGLGSRGASSSARPTPDPEKDRASMPPPPPAKKKQSKTQAKAVPKKAAARANTTGKAVKKTKPAGRSRSVSVAPPPAEDPATTKPEGTKEEEEEDDRLYCVCQTSYDDTKVMIGCDRCDEWYHPHCVNASDLIVELVDQYICPRCAEKFPGVQTTYKRRCFRGLSDPHPDSPSACHKPARGALSKYCSDECGIKLMELRISSFVDAGKTTEDRIWEAVKNAEKREWVVVLPDGTNLPKEEKDKQLERELNGMNKLLERIEKMREQVEAGLDVLNLKEKLLGLACTRAERAGVCGWDQRLCFAEEEWAEFGQAAIESYGEFGDDGDVGEQQQQEGMDVDGNETGQWWCDAPEDCARHSGWQSLRRSDIRQERELKDDALASLTKRERQLRGRMEDALDPQTKVRQAKVPLPLSTDEAQNGVVLNGSKKGSKSKKSGRI